MTAVARMDEVRQKLPEVTARVVEVLADNPAQCGLIISGSFCVARIYGHLVRPRTPIQILMTTAMAYATSMYLVKEARRRGLLVIRVRDENGCLVPVDELERAINADTAS